MSKIMTRSHLLTRTLVACALFGLGACSDPDPKPPTADMAADARDPLVMDAAQFEQRDAPFHAELNRGLGITGKLVRNDADIHRRLHFE